jgi:UDPglucose 6-dehydrogenase
MNISIIGLGFVGSAMKKSFEMKNVDVFGYDKYKDCDHTLEDCLKTEIMFLCLPTKFNEDTCEYDKEPIHEVCDRLNKSGYEGLVVIKSTVEPGTTNTLTEQYTNLTFVHNPEFLTARTAFEDFHNQKHIVLGKGEKDDDIDSLITFYSKLYPKAQISVCLSIESESMKSYVNCFYAVKIQFFNELYLTCQKNGSKYDTVKNLMLKNNWINPMHTTVPGPDGKLSYGGLCFPKDTKALLEYMKKNNIPCGVLEATVEERNEMRSDTVNILGKSETCVNL